MVYKRETDEGSIYPKIKKNEINLADTFGVLIFKSCNCSNTLRSNSNWHDIKYQQQKIYDQNKGY